MSLKNYIDRIKPNFEEGGKLQAFRSVFEGFETFLFVPNATSKNGVNIHDAIDSYIIDQTEPMEDIVRWSPYAQIVADIKADKKRYAKTCEKRAEAGRKGAQSKYNSK